MPIWEPGVRPQVHPVNWSPEKLDAGKAGRRKSSGTSPGDSPLTLQTTHLTAKRFNGRPDSVNGVSRERPASTGTPGGMVACVTNVFSRPFSRVFLGLLVRWSARPPGRALDQLAGLSSLRTERAPASSFFAIANLRVLSLRCILRMTARSCGQHIWTTH